MDIYSPERRSWIMSRIRSCGTQAEDRLYALTRAVLGHRWKILRNHRDWAGSPDVCVPSLRLAIFADGCFFHGCPEHGHTPRSNTEYWSAKIERNMRRDRRTVRLLRAGGIAVLRLWEHDLRAAGIEAAEKKILRAVGRCRRDAASRRG